MLLGITIVIICLRVSMTNNKRQILTKRISCVVYSSAKLRTNEAENSRKFKNSQPQPKIYGSYKKKD